MQGTRYKGQVTEHSLGQSKSGLAGAFISFRLYEQYDPQGGEWLPCQEMYTTGKWWLEKKDGSVNDSAVGQLRKALGWNGRDLDDLNGTKFVGDVVQVDMVTEEYEGKTYWRPNFLMPEDANPAASASAASPETVAAIKARLATKLRAAAGGAPVNAKPQPAPPPQPKPKNAPQAKETRNTGTVATATEEEAWAEHCRVTHGDATAQEAAWYRLLAGTFPGRDATTLTPADWAYLISVIGAATPKDDDLPF